MNKLKSVIAELIVSNTVQHELEIRININWSCFCSVSSAFLMIGFLNLCNKFSTVMSLLIYEINIKTTKVKVIKMARVFLF